MSNQVRAAGGKPVFLQGEVVVNPKTGLPQFVPGTYDGETGKFVPGMVVDTIDGPMFVEGMLHRYHFLLYCMFGKLIWYFICHLQGDTEE